MKKIIKNIKYIKFSAFYLLLMLSFKVMAEYRAYQYIVRSKILNRSGNKLVPKQSIVSSTLSPTSFLAYNGGSSTVEIELLNSWMCPGHTANKEVCNPIQQERNGN